MMALCYVFVGTPYILIIFLPIQHYILFTMHGPSAECQQWNISFVYHHLAIAKVGIPM